MHGKSFNLLDNKEWPYTLVRTLISISELHLPPFLFPLPALSLLGSKKFPIAFFLNLKQHSFKSINNVTLWWVHGWIDHKENIKCLVSRNVWLPSSSSLLLLPLLHFVLQWSYKSDHLLNVQDGLRFYEEKNCRGYSIYLFPSHLSLYLSFFFLLLMITIKEIPDEKQEISGNFISWVYWC